jgi:hypothetical protein
MIERRRRRVFRLIICLLVFSPALFGEGREINLSLHAPFRFIAYGDMRFTNPKRSSVSNAAARRALAQAIADADPAFISLTGDLVAKGDSTEDWKVWDEETAAWRSRSIATFPALGNHDLRGDKTGALTNYFRHFPELENSRYYSVRAASTLILVLDSSLEELSGAQGQWLHDRLDHLPAEINFVIFVLHHPPYTLSSPTITGSGHSARAHEKNLAQWLEARQQGTRARFVVFAGHVHNYERYEHGGVVYFVTGGGGAHPYSVPRDTRDPLFGEKVNYHYLLVEDGGSKLKITMNRLSLEDGKATWTQPDKIEIEAPRAPAKEK